MPDDEVSALALAIAGEGTPDIVETKDSVRPPGKSASREKVTPVSVEKVEPGGEAGSKEGEPGEGGGQEELKVDPLKDVDFQLLLEHPVLGPKLQSWSDRAGAAQVTSALERERQTIEATASRTADERKWDGHFSKLSREDIAAEIASDEDSAVAYAQYQQRRQEPSRLDPEAVAQAAQVYAYASRVSSVSQVIEGSDLTAEVKAGLSPENFTHLGTEGIVAWEKAVFQAMVQHEATQQSQKLLDEKWDTYVQEKSAEGEDETRPAPTVPGRRTANLPDLITTPSEAALEDAFARAESKK